MSHQQTRHRSALQTPASSYWTQATQHLKPHYTPLRIAIRATASATIGSINQKTLPRRVGTAHHSRPQSCSNKNTASFMKFCEFVICIEKGGQCPPYFLHMNAPHGNLPKPRRHGYRFKNRSPKCKLASKNPTLFPQSKRLPDNGTPIIFSVCNNCEIPSVS